MSFQQANLIQSAGLCRSWCKLRKKERRWFLNTDHNRVSAPISNTVIYRKVVLRNNYARNPDFSGAQPLKPRIKLGLILASASSTFLLPIATMPSLIHVTTQPRRRFYQYQGVVLQLNPLNRWIPKTAPILSFPLFSWFRRIRLWVSKTLWAS